MRLQPRPSESGGSRGAAVLGVTSAVLPFISLWTWLSLLNENTCPPSRTCHHAPGGNAQLVLPGNRISPSRHRQPVSIFTEKMRTFLRGHQTSYLSEAPGNGHVTRVPMGPLPDLNGEFSNPHAEGNFTKRILFPRNPFEQASLSWHG